MKKAAYNILPRTEDTLKTLGEQIKLARLRRDLSAALVAERAGISRASLWKVESGNPAVAIGIYAAVLHALDGLDKNLCKVCSDNNNRRRVKLNEWADNQYAMQKNMPVELRVAERGNHKYRSATEDDALIYAAVRAWNNAIKTGWIKKRKGGYRLCEI